MKGDKKLSKTAASGVVALIFMVLGFQMAIFTGNVFRFAKEEQKVDPNETVVAENGIAAADGSNRSAGGIREESVLPTTPPTDKHSSTEHHAGERADAPPRPIVSKTAVAKALTAGDEKAEAPRSAKILFEFDPNTVSFEDLCCLGFSQRQAEVILNYRSKRGKFRSANDFAKMYVVDSLTFERLEPYIKIAKIDLNRADSTALLGLKGIGPYYAHKILEYRQRLGGYFTTLEQLTEIEGMDEERIAGFTESVELSAPPFHFDVFAAEKPALECHPYIGPYAAKGILRYKSTVDSTQWSISDLVEKGILHSEVADKL